MVGLSDEIITLKDDITLDDELRGAKLVKVSALRSTLLELKISLCLRAEVPPCNECLICKEINKLFGRELA